MIGDSFTPKVVLLNAEESCLPFSSMGDTDLTVFTLAFEERESLLEVFRSLEMLMGDAIDGDFFTGLVSDSVFRGSLKVAGFAGLLFTDCEEET